MRACTSINVAARAVWRHKENKFRRSIFQQHNHQGGEARVSGLRVPEKRDQQHAAQHPASQSLPSDTMSGTEKTTEEQGQRVITGGCPSSLSRWLAVATLSVHVRQGCLYGYFVLVCAACLCCWLFFLAYWLLPPWRTDWLTLSFSFPLSALLGLAPPSPQTWPFHAHSYTFIHAHAYMVAASQHHYRHGEVVQCPKRLWIHNSVSPSLSLPLSHLFFLCVVHLVVQWLLSMLQVTLNVTCLC